MANARKCDMCKTCYDPLEQEGLMCRFENPIFQDSHDLQEGIVTRRLINGPADIYVDLCPKCSEKFLDMFQEKETGYFFDKSFFDKFMKDLKGDDIDE